MHISQIGFYSPDENSHGRMTLERLQRYVGDRIHGLPLTLKLLEVPFKADYPYWIEDEDFLLDEHLREIKLPSKADYNTLIKIAVDAAEQPLDRNKPLWEMCLITGLGKLKEFPAGSFAVMLKVHHAQFDGTNFNRFSVALHSPPAEKSADSSKPKAAPGAARLLARVPWNRSVWWWKGVTRIGKTLPSMASTLVQREGGEQGDGKLLPQATRFSGSIRSPRRVIGKVDFDFSELKALARCVEGATLIDVLVTLLGGALRKYLSAHDELPERAIEVTMPVSAHEEGESSDSGNRVVTMPVSTCSNEGDARRRMEGVVKSTRMAKAKLQKLGIASTADLMEVLPTNLMGVGVSLMAKTHLADHLKLGSGIGLTNMPGPRDPQYLDGFRANGSLAVPFLMDGMGLLLAAISYEDKFPVQFISSPEMLPDPEFLESCIREAYAELASEVAH